MGKSFSLNSFDPVDIVLSTDDTFADMMVQSEENANKTAEDIIRPYVETGLMSMEALEEETGICNASVGDETVSVDMLDMYADDIIEVESEDDVFDDAIGDMIDCMICGDCE